jgi:peptidoglycan/xylan/chitin deacetylase (PgdA/CDA1 family)
MISRGRFLRLFAAGAATLAAGRTLSAQESTLVAEPGAASPTVPTGAAATTPEMGEYELSPHYVHSGPGFGNRLAITFDDGPTPGVTETVLEELRKRNLHATFFMIGEKAARTPALAKMVADAGHEIGNHTYTHPNLAQLSDDKVRYQLSKAQEAIHAASGHLPTWFRPPYGAFKKQQGYIAAELGLGVTYWSVDPTDWRQPGPEKIISGVVNYAVPGSIILMHDLHRQTADSVGRVLDGLLVKDYAFSTISGFLGNPYPGKMVA